MNSWHPWRLARDLHPDLDIDCTRRLSPGHMGLIGRRTIWLHRGLSQAERRCTLTHELVHIERRGREHHDPDVEEQIVELESARRLVTLEQLVDAFLWLRHPCLHDLADHLWVDQQTAWMRMEHLDPLEVAAVEAACDGDWSWQPPA
ncbi:ImmA/IrrE family metallo-endopeptidase [Gordonia shandongensis]|uniref:ImmA/IrrE family metallo-endopeptidase n=1 Tax=Gordonia shandongensis TaxID=376351 RepID=UPI000422289C|nr:ImmA/IrrE family metallo-endopeptidase [Gordonia shandongensis]